MNFDFNLVCLIFIGYSIHSTLAGKKDEVHVKIHVPEIIKHLHHTKVVLVKAPSKPHHHHVAKKPVIVHHHHHHKHDHGHKHNHGHKHKHAHKHVAHHPHAKKPHHHHKKKKYISDVRIVSRFPNEAYKDYRRSQKKEHLRSLSMMRPAPQFDSYSDPAYYSSHYDVNEDAEDFTTSSYGLYKYPPTAVEEFVEDDLSHEAKLADYAADDHYESFPLSHDGYYNYEEETRRHALGIPPDPNYILSKTVSVTAIPGI